jgi:hypothetical protein
MMSACSCSGDVCPVRIGARLARGLTVLPPSVLCEHLNAAIHIRRNNFLNRSFQPRKGLAKGSFGHSMSALNMLKCRFV